MKSSFLNNKYSRWYFSIVENAKCRTVDGYTERHHITPKCIGGDNSAENLVNLTAREHFICHWLLTKMVVSVKHRYQMWNAFSCMLYRENSSQERYKVTSRVFENIKKEGAKIKSEKFTGENNPGYGIRGELHPLFGKKVSEETRHKMSLAHIGQTRSIESRQKQSAKTTGRKQTEEHIAKRSRSGNQNHMYGKKKSPESIAKMLATREKNRLLKLEQGELKFLA